MRVVMFCSQFYPIVGGAERQAERLGCAIARRGLAVTVWTPRPNRDALGVEVRECLQIRRFPLFDLATRFPGVRGIGLVNGPFIAFQIATKLWAAIGEADIVHCHIGGLQSVAVALTSRLRGVPVICKAAMAGEQSDLGEIAQIGLVGKIVALLGRTAFTRWVATTLAVRNALIRAGVEASIIEVVPNGIDVPSVTPPSRSRAARRFLYLGRLSTNIQRDVPGLLKSFDALADDVSDAELAIVGDGDQLSATRDLARCCRNAARIQIPGFGNSGSWLSWADCLVLPSRREGLSNALLEAMASGLPCIANDIPPNREVLDGGNAGVLVPVEDHLSLTNAMRRIALDRIYALDMGTSAYSRVSSCYSMNSVVDKYLAIYGALIPARKLKGM